MFIKLFFFFFFLLKMERYLNQAAVEIAEINATGKSFWKLTSKQASYEKEKKAFVDGSFCKFFS